MQCVLFCGLRGFICFQVCFYGLWCFGFVFTSVVFTLTLYNYGLDFIFKFLFTGGFGGDY